MILSVHVGGNRTYVHIRHKYCQRLNCFTDPLTWAQRAC
jgi:hypothetical protein